MRRTMFVISLVFASTATVASAQKVVARDGWEAFYADYVRGDGSQGKPLYGMLVLTDSSLAIHKCVANPHCVDDPKKGFFLPQPLYSIPLKAIQSVESKIGRDRGAVYPALVVAYASGNTVEVPEFKFENTPSAEAAELKLRYRLKKLGVTIPEKK